jgi:hypothetical protein
LTTALVIGGAACVWEDVYAARHIRRDAVIACNEIGIEWPGEIDAWVSLHARSFDTGPNWIKGRADNGHPPARRYFGHHGAFKGSRRDYSRIPSFATATDYSFANEKSGSSGLFAAKVALVDLGFDRVVLAGVPMTPTKHFDGRDRWTRPNAGGKTSAHGFRNSWLAVPQEYRDRMRSMSGWTRVLLGAPDEMKETTNA